MARLVEVRQNGRVLWAHACRNHDLDAGQFGPRYVGMDEDGVPEFVTKEEHDWLVSGGERTTMDMTKHKAAVDALTELMLSELQGTGRDKFARVNRLTTLASKLQLEEAKVEDMDAQNHLLGEYENGGMNVIGGYAGGGGRLALPGGDQAQMVRELMTVLVPQVDTQVASNEARARECMASELRELVGVRGFLLAGPQVDHMAASKVTKRINAIIEQLGQKDAEYEDEPGETERQLRVVHPVGIRGHQAGEDQLLLDAGESGRSLADGAGGGEGAPAARAEAGGDGDAVGHGV